MSLFSDETVKMLGPMIQRAVDGVIDDLADELTEKAVAEFRPQARAKILASVLRVGAAADVHFERNGTILTLRITFDERTPDAALRG